MYIINVVEFSDWIEGKYIEWRGSSRRTITEYATYLGVPQSLLSQWMKRGGKTPNSIKYINALSAKYGTKEVYEILGFPRLDPLPDKIDFRRRVRLAVQEAVDEMTSKGIKPESEAGQKIIEAAAERYSLNTKREDTD